MEKSKIQVTIIGGGLSAIYSYWGALDAGFLPEDIEVLTPGISLNAGAVFMYECPINWRSVAVTSILLGSPQGYAFKQWKDGSIKTSVDTRFRHGNMVIESLYDPEEVMPTLWGMIPNLHPQDSLSLQAIDNLKKNRKAVIATFANTYVRENRSELHSIATIPVYSRAFQATNYVVIYNGLPEIPWVRQTIMPGRCYVEYPTDTRPDFILDYETNRGLGGGTMTLVPNLKPDCVPLTNREKIEDNLLRVGRFATFTQGYLSHQARVDVREFLEKLK